MSKRFIIMDKNFLLVVKNNLVIIKKNENLSKSTTKQKVIIINISLTKYDKNRMATQFRIFKNPS